MTTRRVRWILASALLLVLLLQATVSWSQTVPINGNLVVAGSQNFCDTTGSSVNAYACNLGFAITQYAIGNMYLFKANLANTGSATLQLNGIATPVTIQKVEAGTLVNLSAGDIAANDFALVTYTGTVMRLLSSRATFPTQLAANPTNCSAGSFPLGVDAAGVVENCTALPTSISGTALQIAASASTGAITLSIPSSPTLPGTTTGTFSGSLTGNASTATALAANGANCTVAGAFPNGVDASGAAENCVTLSAVNPQTTTYPVVAADFDSYKTITVASGTFTITLLINTSQPAAGKYIRVINYGSGVVTIARNGQNLNGGTASLVLPPSSATAPTAAQIISDGTNYFGDTSFGNPLTTAGDVLYGGASGTPTRLATGTAKQILTAGTTPAYIDFPDFHYFPAANCVNAVAGVAWSTGATPAGACRAGTNNLEGYLTWGASDTAQWHIGLPLDWNSAVNPSVSLQLASTDAVNGHTVIMQLATACAKGDGTVTDDVAFNTAQSFATVTLNGTASRQWKTTVSNITMTGCTAGGMLRLKLSRTTDTATNVQVYGLGITIPRLLTVQAN